jgi:light-regulated signal transduction histidine kinase (bacteriophytochrome)
MTKLIEETLKDNKELRAAQESLKDINTELSRKNGELEQFAYVASHDLQEPLRKIRNFISLAERGIKDEEKSALYLDKINDSAERMSLLVRDILNYSTLNSLNDEFEEINLNGIVADVVKDFDLHFKEGNAQIFVDKLPVVRGISVQMSQLFYNFIGNAIKFTDINPIININYFRAEILEHGETIAPGIYHCISVKDNGIGIEEQYMSKIFSIFQRLHPQSSYKGTGIGLSLCKKIAENHKGTITVESTPGVGSDFSIYLPV